MIEFSLPNNNCDFFNYDIHEDTFYALILYQGGVSVSSFPFPSINYG